VLIALRNNIVAEELDLSLLHDVLPFIECVGCKCTFGKNVLFIYVVYFPKTPSSIHLQTFCDYFEEQFGFCENILLVGDFNIPEYVNLISNLATIINNFSNFLNLKQFNNVSNHNDRLLDLVLSSIKC